MAENAPGPEAGKLENVRASEGGSHGKRFVMVLLVAGLLLAIFLPAFRARTRAEATTCINHLTLQHESERGNARQSSGRLPYSLPSVSRTKRTEHK